MLTLKKRESVEDNEDDLTGMTEITHHVELLLPLLQIQEWLNYKTETL